MLDKAKEIEEYMISFRRKMHENPELSNSEVQTQSMIENELKELGIEYKKCGNTSLIAKIKGNKEGKIVALRADIDALPIEEQADVEFKSKNKGVMHACGHDAHTSMLLGAAKILNSMKDKINGEIRFFFQEGEEVFGGAKKIVEAGGMDGVDAIFGMHGMPQLKTSEASAQAGYILSGCDTIYVDFEGVSGHGASPHLAKDTIHPACIFVTDLQGIVTKNISPQEPIVLSVGKFNGGTKANIISKYTSLEISMRYFNPEARKTVHEAIKRHANNIANMYEIKATVRVEESTLSLLNDEKLSQFARDIITKGLGEDSLKVLGPQMNSEDFSYYLTKAPGAYLFVGYRNEEKGAIYPPHHEKFKLDEDYLKYGTSLYIDLALNYLNSEL